MGHIKKMLGCRKVDPRAITPNMIWTDLCENVHLHYRNVRLEFSELEFATFRAAINQLGRAAEHVAVTNDYKEGDPNFLIQQMFNIPLRVDSDYYPNRVTLELQKDNTVHFHYRDLRLHFSQPEFEAIAKVFADGLMKFKTRKDFPYKPEKKTLYRDVPIVLIQPYDEGHRPMAEDQDHIDGIEYVKSLIAQGKKIRPILVDTTGQRLDGYKRYMAFKELGRRTIDCYVDPFGIMGGQHNQGMVCDDE